MDAILIINDGGTYDWKIILRHDLIAVTRNEYGILR